MTKRQIFIAGNCQVRPIADVLRMCFPEDEIIDIEHWDFSDVENTVGAMNYLRTFDVQLRMPDNQCPLRLEDIDPLPHQRIIRIPSIHFPAFHPDLVYATLGDGSLFRGATDYHSAIGLWAWSHGLDAATAASLFDEAVFRELGYEDYWETSRVALKSAFEASDVEFRPFWRHCQRLGVFMHTVNHPVPAAVGLLAKSVARLLDAPASSSDEPLERYLNDYCSSEVWPVYPSIARRLGVPGSWRWRVHDVHLEGPRAWLDFSFEGYRDLDPASFICHRLLDGLYDEVLGARLGVGQSSS